ncbi:MAG: hypothetical protein JRE58_09810 [Deltaproteobacteria bacterium]|nr:hypothetical protein [Deltaproteobacteria bacterium]MBW2593272.1 hypothetical protein [Deltaproteobacteria bacterium]
MKLIQPSGEHRLDEVRIQFEQWRNSRDKRKAIPEALWDAAASLYPAQSLHQISKALRLNHTKLKHYVQGPSPELSMPAASFIEVDLAGPASPCKGIAEMRHQNGDMMTMQVMDSRDLMKLARLFWSRP